jgi:Uma2 family endonuclease
VYCARTPGVEGLENATTVMDELGVPQPDVQLRILPEYGGQPDEGNFVAGAPELVVEVARSSRPIDLGAKRADYERAGVKEYVVVTIDPDEVHWHVRHVKSSSHSPDPDGLYQSKVFPGLWLDPTALLEGHRAGSDPWTAPGRARRLRRPLGRRGRARNPREVSIRRPSGQFRRQRP